MKSIWRDAEISLRHLVRRPATPIFIVLCLSFGLGANGIMIRVLDQFFFRPPELVLKPEQLRRFYFSFSSSGQGRVLSAATSYPAFVDLRRAKSLSGVASYTQAELPVGFGKNAPRKILVTAVSHDFFGILGARPILGRTFIPLESQETNGNPAALISERAWRDDYGGRPDVLGQPLRVGRALYTIVGVLPTRFTGVELNSVAVWLPLHASAHIFGPEWHLNRGSALLVVIGRLRDRIRVEAAEEELTALYCVGHREAGREAPPDSRVLLGPIQRAWGPGAQLMTRVSIWLTVVSLAVLFITCANVSNLLIIQSFRRRREIAIRLALGLGRARLVRTVFLEGFVLTALGGIGALLVMYNGGSLFQTLLLPNIPLATLVDFRMVGWLLFFVFVTSLACVGAPAIWASRCAPNEAIKGLTGSSGASLITIRRFFVSSQIAFTFVLLAGTGLFVRSLQNLNQVRLGLEPSRVMVAMVDLQNEPEFTPSQVQEIYQQAHARVQLLPGVEDASIAATIPLIMSKALPVSVPDRMVLPQLSTGGPYVNGISETFFSTLGTAIRRGRAFTDQDRKGSESVAIINETFARLVWPDRDAIGQCLVIGEPSSPCSRIVGVVQDALRSNLQEAPTPQIYVPLSQAPSSLPPQALFVRFKGAPERFAGLIRREFQGVAPNLPWVEVVNMADLVADQVKPWRIGATMFLIFGSLALLLAGIGIYVNISFSLAQKLHEMGVRLALGASWLHLIQVGLSEALGSFARGTTIGLACLLFCGYFLQPLLLGVSVADPLVIMLSALVLGSAAVTACFVPILALRRIDPTEVLRQER